MEQTEDWQQHYPTYKFEAKEIVLAEYKAASTMIDAEERLFTSSANIVLLVAAGVGSLVFGSLSTVYERLAPAVSAEGVLIALLLLLCASTVVTVKYFTERQKTILFAKRKVVVLRRMLGLDYGRFQLVLPNWRVEGANQPFAIRLFPGWLSFVAYPFWIVTLCSTIALFVLVASYLETLHLQWRITAEAVAFFAASGWYLVLAFVFRSSLYDTHEGLRLSISRVVARTLRIPVVPDFESVIYRATLARYEHERHKLENRIIHPILIFLEDRDFNAHRGISLRGIGRALRDWLRGRRMSGGSTITQQLVRSLFIARYRGPYRRKVVELCLARWCEVTFSKRDILDLYVASVRYAEGVYGWFAATTHFFGRMIATPSPAEAFFLVERISNIRDRVLVKRLDSLLTQAVHDKILTASDATLVVELYAGQVRRGRLTVEDRESFARLQKNWT